MRVRDESTGHIPGTTITTAGGRGLPAANFGTRPGSGQHARKSLLTRLGLFLCALLTGMIALSGCVHYSRSPAKRMSYEDKVGREFALEASEVFRLIDEPELLDFTKALGHLIADQLVGSRINYRFFVIRDPVVNAFAVPGGYIYVFAGLPAQAKSIHEVAGVLAHEIGHVEGNHFIRGQKKMDVANIAALAATILAATVGGAEHAVAVGTIAQATRQTASLQYSREFEAEADSTSIQLCYKAGFDPQGILSLFDTFHSQSRLNASDLPPYFSTHPLPAERIYEVKSWIQALELPSRAQAIFPGFDLAKITARLRTEKDDRVFVEQEAATIASPDNARAQFLLGYLYLKRGDLDLAEKHLDKACRLAPSNLEYTLYFARASQLSGNLERARHLLNIVQKKDPGNTMAQIFLGDLMVQLDEWKDALRHYQKALILTPDSSFAHMSLGMAYGRRKQTGMSYYHLGLAVKSAGRYLKALYYFEKSLGHLDSKSKEALTIRREIEKLKG